MRKKQRLPESIRYLLVTTVFTAVALWGVGCYRDRDARALRNQIRESLSAACDAKTTLFEGRSVADLIQCAHTGSDSDRQLAVYALGLVYGGFHSFCQDRPSHQSRRVMLALVEGGLVAPRAAVVLPALLHALEDPCAGVRRAAASVLAEMYAPALPACDTLRKILGDQDIETRLWAARALYSIRFETEGPVATSLDVLQHDADPRNRKMAVCNLEDMAYEAPSAFRALESAMTDSDEGVRNMASQAMTVILACQPRKP
jgi:HEAT repeats